MTDRTTYEARTTANRFQPYDAILAHELIGPDAMAGGYRALLPLQPPYGSPLSDAAKQAFVRTLQQSLRDQAFVKLSAVTF